MLLGNIKKLLDNNGNPAYPVTIAEAVFVDQQQSLKDKLNELGGKVTYIVDLDKWGIVPGIPSKPYQLADYQTAYNNVAAFNRLLYWASQNGYLHVILPKNKYTFNYPIPIQMADNVTLNLNGSTLKVIFDSDSQNPYDTSGSPDYWRFGGVLFKFTNVSHAHITNGIILGDGYDRSFLSAGEASVEWTYGVMFEQSSSYCSVSHCKISAFMGDNISYASSGSVQTGITGTSVLSDIDSATGNLTALAANTTAVITAMQAIPKNPAPGGTNFEVWSMAGSGYARQTALISKEFSIYYYKADGTYLGWFLNYRVQQNVPIPRDATQFRLKFYNETDPLKDPQILIQWGGFVKFCTTEYNEIFFGHRGGISGGGSYCTITRNWIHDNGGSANFYSKMPQFTDSTKYAINQEDSYGDNTIIKDNVFTGGFHGVLIRGYSAFVENNIFANLSGSSIVVYDMGFITIRGNHIRRAGITLFGAGTARNPHVNITENYFYKSGISPNDTYDVIVSNNFFIDAGAQAGVNGKWENNTFRIVDVTNYVQQFNFNSRCKGNTIYGDPTFDTGKSKPAVLLGNVELSDHEFTNCDVRSNTLVTEIRPTKINNCKFVNAKLTNQSNWHQIEVTNSYFVDSVIGGSNINGTVNQMSMKVSNSTFEVTTATDIFEPTCNVVQGVLLTVDNCTFTIRNATFGKIMNAQFTNTNTTTTFTNNTFTYTGTTTLVIPFYGNDGSVYKAWHGKNKANNIIFTGMVGTKFNTFDPKTQSDVEPSAGFFFYGARVENGKPLPGGYQGWICTTQGFADSATWAASSPYTAGSKVTASGYVYEAQNTGKSAKSSPTFPTTGTFPTVVDNAGINTWVSGGFAYSVGDLVFPTVANGFYYECTTGGTSGTSQPTWSTTDGQTTNDNGIIWTTRTLITWKQVGPKAVFKQYGLISG